MGAESTRRLILLVFNNKNKVQRDGVVAPAHGHLRNAERVATTANDIVVASESVCAVKIVCSLLFQIVMASRYASDRISCLYRKP